MEGNSIHSDFEDLFAVRSGHGVGGAAGPEPVAAAAADDTVTLLHGIYTIDMGPGRSHLIIDYRGPSFVGNTTMTTSETSPGTYSGSMTSIFNGGDNGTVHFTGVEDFTVMTDNTGGNGSNSVDNITTGDGDDIIFTYHSRDLIDVGTGTDQVDGGTGIDGLAKVFDRTDAAIIFNLSENTFTGRGSFTNIDYFIDLRTTNGDDVIVTSLANDSGTSAGDDTIFTYGGDDTVTLFNDDDSVDLGSGVDRLILDYSASAFQGDTIMEISGSGPYSGTFVGSFSSAGSVTFAGVEHFTVITNNGGGSGSNSRDDITTGAGNDVVSTFQSNDVINVGTGKDRVDGGTGLDGLAKEFDRSDAALNFNLAKNTFTGRGSFTNIDYFVKLRATNNDDVIVTGLANESGTTVGDDTIFTFRGNDTVTLHNDNDTVNMGRGNDHLILDYRNSAFQGDTTMLVSGGGTYSGNFDGSFGSAAHVTFTGVERFTVMTNKGGGSGSNSRDNITTGNGDDRIYTYQSVDTIDAGNGDDFVDAGAGNDVVRGGGGDDTILGGAGSYSESGNDVLNGGGGADTIKGGGGHDELIGGSGNDKLIGNSGDDVMNGGQGDDLLKGGSDNDQMFGGNGKDKLIGNGGDDVLNGGKDKDVLKGGVGADLFQFNSANESRVGNADRILDFRSGQGDRIDLRGVDAQPGGDDQAFTFIGGDRFSGDRGELRLVAKGDDLRVLGDIDGDGSADFEISLRNVSTLVAEDFIL